MLDTLAEFDITRPVNYLTQIAFLVRIIEDDVIPELRKFSDAHQADLHAIEGFTEFMGEIATMVDAIEALRTFRPLYNAEAAMLTLKETIEKIIGVLESLQAAHPELTAVKGFTEFMAQIGSAVDAFTALQTMRPIGQNIVTTFKQNLEQVVTALLEVAAWLKTKGADVRERLVEAAKTLDPVSGALSVVDGLLKLGTYWRSIQREVSRTTVNGVTTVNTQLSLFIGDLEAFITELAKLGDKLTKFGTSTEIADRIKAIAGILMDCQAAFATADEILANIWKHADPGKYAGIIEGWLENVAQLLTGLSNIGDFYYGESGDRLSAFALMVQNVANAFNALFAMMAGDISTKAYSGGFLVGMAIMNGVSDSLKQFGARLALALGELYLFANKAMAAGAYNSGYNVGYAMGNGIYDGLKSWSKTILDYLEFLRGQANSVMPPAPSGNGTDNASNDASQNQSNVFNFTMNGVNIRSDADVKAVAYEVSRIIGADTRRQMSFYSGRRGA